MPLVLCTVFSSNVWTDILICLFIISLLHLQKQKSQPVSCIFKQIFLGKTDFSFSPIQITFYAISREVTLAAQRWSESANVMQTLAWYSASTKCFSDIQFLRSSPPPPPKQKTKQKQNFVIYIHPNRKHINMSSYPRKWLRNRHGSRVWAVLFDEFILNLTCDNVSTTNNQNLNSDLSFCH